MPSLCRMYNINAAFGIRMLWNTIKSFLDPKTVAKIQNVADSDRVSRVVYG